MILRKASPMNDSIDDPVLDHAKLIKLEAGARSSVQFKPSKRMKKRRQLDALVGNDKKLPRRKHSAHELLRSNDSGSSEVEEFAIMHGHKLDKSWTSSSCCFTCYSLTCAVMVTICLLACATLIWMHLQLKQDFNDLRDRLELVENKNVATPQELQAVQSQLSEIDKTLTDIRTGKSGLQSLNKSIVSMQAQIASLTAAQQQQNVETSNSDSSNSADITKTVADLGSGLHSAQEDVKSLTNTQKTFTTQLQHLTDRVTALENPHGREGVVSQSDTEGLQVLVRQVNTTLSQSITKVVADLNKQQTHIEAVDQFTQDLQERVTRVHQLAVGLNTSQHLLLEALLPDDSSNTGETDLAQLQNQVNQLQQTLDKGLFLLHQLQSGGSNLTDMNTDLSSPPPSDNLFPALLKDHADFIHFKNEMYQDINSLNASVAAMTGIVSVLKEDVGDLSTKVNLAIGNIANITTVVEGVVRLVHSHDLSQSGKSAEGNGSTVRSTVEETVQKTTPASNHSPQPAQHSSGKTTPSSAR